MNETPKAALAFQEYCLMGPDRSLAKLADRGRNEGKPWARLATVETWSSQQDWVERASQYDLERIAERQRKQEEAIQKMDEEHALIGRTQALRAVKQIEELIKAQKFGSQAAVQLLKVATDLERLARGASTSRTEITGTIDLETTITVNLKGATLEELRSIKSITRAIAERTAPHDRSA